MSALTSCCAAVFFQVRDLQTLVEKWNITGPGFSYGNLSFDLGYQVSDFILNQMVDYTIWDVACKKGGVSVPDTVLSANMTGDETPMGNGTLSRDFDMQLGVNPANIAQAGIYYEQIREGQLTAEVAFCVRFSLWTYSDEPIEVNYRETLVNLTIDLTDGFSIDEINVEPKEKITATANEAFEVDAFQCNAINGALSTQQLSASRIQGSIVRVCVQPDLRAIVQGIFMRNIDGFVFSRAYGNGIPDAVQVSVLNGQEASDGLTFLDCTAGEQTCSFETILSAAFYRNAGVVQGSGIASVQFGTSSARRLRSGDRNLQQAPTAEFNMNFDLVRTPKAYYSGEFRSDGTRSSGSVALVGLLIASTIQLLL